LVRQLVASGMDIARINCAHDGPVAKTQIPIAVSPAITSPVHPAVSSLGASPTPAHRLHHFLSYLRVWAGIGQPLTVAAG
jgi:hypothetical protein